MVDNNVRLIKELLGNITKSEIDYYFEVNGNTKLGMPGRFKEDNNIIHFEIFTDNVAFIPASDIAENWDYNWKPEEAKFIKVPESRIRNDFFNANNIVGNLHKVNFIRVPVCFEDLTSTRVASSVLHAFLANSIDTLQYAIVQHLHCHANPINGLIKK
jgi:hypothetical protein